MKVKVVKLKITCSVLFLLITVWLSGQNPNWQAPNSKNFAFTANVISIINIDDLRSNNSEDRIAFFVGSELRGLSKPITALGGKVHFVTIYSNTPTESITVKIFQFATSTVYDVAGTFQYTTQSIKGSIVQPLIFNGYTGNDAPISITSIPDQETILPVPFISIDLNDYLIQPDTSSVIWSFIPNPFLVVNIIDGILSVTGTQDLVGQETTLLVKATESTGKMATAKIIFRILSDFLAPAWNNIPNQTIAISTQFADFDLDDFEYQYNGQHLLYDYMPIIEQSVDTVAMPMWSLDSLYKNTMSVTARVQYTPKYIFDHPDDILIAIINDTIRGMARRNSASGLYFIPIGGAHVGDYVKFQFYSGLKKEILHWVDSLTYKAYIIVGIADVPFPLDFSPLVPTIMPNGETSITIKDLDWTGFMTFDFIAKDSTYPTYKFANKKATFCILYDVTNQEIFYQDADGDGLGNPNVFVYACVAPEGYVSNNTDCNDTNPVDPLLVTTITETSGSTNNDGYVCSGALVIIDASGGQSYFWSTGATTASITVTPSITTTYTVTVTHAAGCQGTQPVKINVEGTVVRQSSNDGFGSLRQVLNCCIEGSIITYDQPTINNSLLTTPLIITKNATIKGFNAIFRPKIHIDFLNSNVGLNIENNKVLELENIDISVDNNINSLPAISGLGNLVIKSKTVVKNL